MSNTFIYALRNPITKDVFYIGKADNPKKRLSNHIHTMKGYFKVPDLYLLIKEIIEAGKVPDLIVLDEVNKEEWEDKEKQYISEYRNRGANLLNLTDGGRAFGLNCVEKSRTMQSKPILQYDMSGIFIKEWKSIREAARVSKCAKSSIYASLNTYHKTCIGFYWRFKIGSDIPQVIQPKKRQYTAKPIYQILDNGEEFLWESIRSAANSLNINETALSVALRRSGNIKGYKFKRDETNKRWQKPHGKLNQKLVNYKYIDPSEYSFIQTDSQTP